MKRVVLNIGLNNNPFNMDGIMNQLSLPSSLTAVDWFEKDSEYLGAVEPTAVVSMYTKLDDEGILSYIEGLCSTFTQECIAVMIDEVGYLVYRPGFDGERYEFNEQYFILCR